MMVVGTCPPRNYFERNICFFQATTKDIVRDLLIFRRFFLSVSVICLEVIDLCLCLFKRHVLKDLFSSTLFFCRNMSTRVSTLTHDGNERENLTFVFMRENSGTLGIWCKMK